MDDSSDPKYWQAVVAAFVRRSCHWSVHRRSMQVASRRVATAAGTVASSSRLSRRAALHSGSVIACRRLVDSHFPAPVVPSAAPGIMAEVSTPARKLLPTLVVPSRYDLQLAVDNTVGMARRASGGEPCRDVGDSLIARLADVQIPRPRQYCCDDSSAHCNNCAALDRSDSRRRHPGVCLLHVGQMIPLADT